jgi:hypothetical protein
MATSQDLHQASAKGAQYCRFQARPRLSPVDLLDNRQGARVNVDALRALQHEQLATSDVAAQCVLGDAGYLYNALEWPAPRFGDSAVQVTDPPVDGTLGAAEIKCDRWRRQETDCLLYIPVFCRGPGCLATISELNTSCLPGGAKTREVAQDSVTRGKTAAPGLTPPAAV